MFEGQCTMGGGDAQRAEQDRKVAFFPRTARATAEGDARIAVASGTTSRRSTPTARSSPARLAGPPSHARDPMLELNYSLARPDRPLRGPLDRARSGCWFGPAMRVIARAQRALGGRVEKARAIQAEAERSAREHAAAIEQARAEAQREVAGDHARAPRPSSKQLIGEAQRRGAAHADRRARRGSPRTSPPRAKSSGDEVGAHRAARSRARCWGGRYDGRARRAPSRRSATLLFPAINFAIFAVVLVALPAGPDPRVLPRADRAAARGARRRQARAARGRGAARRSSSATSRELPGTSERLKADLRADRRARARQRSSAQGRQAADRIRADARLLAEHEVAAARSALRAEVVEEAIRQATALVREAITRRGPGAFRARLRRSGRRGPAA